MRTPYVLKSRTNFVSFMYFLLNSTTDSDSLCVQVMKKLLNKFSATRK